MAFTSVATLMYKSPGTVQWGNSVKEDLDYLITGASRAWLRFDGVVWTGTITATNAHNVDTVQKNAAGNYTMKFKTPFTHTDFVFLGTAGNTGAAGVVTVSPITVTTTSVQFIVANVNDTVADAAIISVAVFGVGGF